MLKASRVADQNSQFGCLNSGRELWSQFQSLLWMMSLA
jgi:hypothetical protein